MLPAYACQEFLDGVDRFGLGDGGIPRFDDLNKVLGKATGWEVVGVEGLLPDEVFFDHLANRRFPVSWWIRKPDQLDYLAEPDLFHDLFGHVPLLLNPVFADYMQAYGKGGMKAHAIGPDALMNLTRLYWYTVEFGLIRTDAGLRIYGAGIVSSKGESIYSIDSPAPNRIGFDLERVMNTRYKIDTYQQTYFVIDDFKQLFDATRPDFTPIYTRLAGGTPVAAETCWRRTRCISAVRGKASFPAQTTETQRWPNERASTMGPTPLNRVGPSWSSSTFRSSPSVPVFGCCRKTSSSTGILLTR